MEENKQSNAEKLENAIKQFNERLFQEFAEKEFTEEEFIKYINKYASQKIRVIDKNGKVTYSDNPNYMFGDIDFNDKGIEEIIDRLLKNIFNKFDNKISSSYNEIFLAHFLYAKKEAARMGVGETPFVYLNRKESVGVSGGAYYSMNNKLIVFKSYNIFGYSDMYDYTSDYSNGKPESRKSHFVEKVLFETTHEIKHAKQFLDIQEFGSDPTKVTPESYMFELQNSARMIDNMTYEKNHDEFAIELDADREAFSRTNQVLQEIDPEFAEFYKKEETGFNFSGLETQQTVVDPKKNGTQISRVKRIEKQEKIENKLNDPNKSKWAHKTNANNKLTPANYKASIIIDKEFPRLNQIDRDLLFKKYPAMRLSRNSDGSRKPLDEIKQGLENEETKALYQQIIDSDPLYSLEFSLQKVVENSNPRETSKNARRSQEVLMYLEELQYHEADEIIKKYRHEIESKKGHIGAKTNDSNIITNEPTYHDVTKLKEQIKRMDIYNNEIRKAKVKEKKLELLNEQLSVVAKNEDEKQTKKFAQEALKTLRDLEGYWTKETKRVICKYSPRINAIRACINAPEKYASPDIVRDRGTYDALTALREEIRKFERQMENITLEENQHSGHGKKDSSKEEEQVSME